VRLCVFCGSSTGRNPAFAAAAHALGGVMAARQIGLVYAGGNVGLMGIVADATLADGFIALPGGFGTLEEFCEAGTWTQLGVHQKPCGFSIAMASATRCSPSLRTRSTRSFCGRPTAKS
jgi:predicted Rossmann-fold nucleotide-binding protein